jgi:REP element-mobilizing transposase RayT
MRHRPREEEAGAVHHVVAQGNGRTPIVLDDRDRREFSKRFDAMAVGFGWIVHTSCLMGTHHHAILETPEPNLGRGMQRVLGGYAYVFNKRHGREGHLFHGPFWSRRVHRDGHLLTACLYAVLNPVAAGLCVHPGAWPWSSYRRILAGGGTARLMGLFGRSSAEAIARYVEVVDTATAVLLEQRAADGSGLLRIARGAVAGELHGSG